MMQMHSQSVGTTVANSCLPSNLVLTSRHRFRLPALNHKVVGTPAWCKSLRQRHHSGAPRRSLVPIAAADGSAASPTVLPATAVIRIGDALRWAYAAVAAALFAAALLGMFGGDTVSRVLFGPDGPVGSPPLLLLAAAGASLLPVACSAGVLLVAGRPQGLGRRIFDASALALLLHGVMGLWLLEHAISLHGDTGLIVLLGVLFCSSILTAFVGLDQSARTCGVPGSVVGLVVVRAWRTVLTLLRADFWGRWLRSPLAIAHAVVSATLIGAGHVIHSAYPGTDQVPLLFAVDAPSTFLYRLTAHGLLAAALLGFYVVHTHTLRRPSASLSVSAVGGSGGESSGSDTDDAPPIGDVAGAAVIFCSSMQCVTEGLDSSSSESSSEGEAGRAGGGGGGGGVEELGPEAGARSPDVTPPLSVTDSGTGETQKAYFDLGVFLRVGLGGMMGTHFVMLLLAACQGTLRSHPSVLWTVAVMFAGAALCTHYIRTVLQSVSKLQPAVIVA